jgi:hypothetical protein
MEYVVFLDEKTSFLYGSTNLTVASPTSPVVPIATALVLLDWKFDT